MKLVSTGGLLLGTGTSGEAASVKIERNGQSSVSIPLSRPRLQASLSLLGLLVRPGVVVGE